MEQELSARLDLRVAPELRGKLIDQAGELGRDLSAHTRDLLSLAAAFDTAELQALQVHLETLIAIRNRGRIKTG